MISKLIYDHTKYTKILKDELTEISLSFFAFFATFLCILQQQHEAKHLPSYGRRFIPVSQVVLRAGCGSRQTLSHI